MTTAYAVALGETASTPPGPVAVLAVTVVLLLLLGAVFWSFLRRARREGVAPLAVDRRDTGSRPAQASTAGTPGNATSGTGATGNATSGTRTPDAGTADDAETAAAIQDEIAEGGPVDGREERS